MLNPQDMTREEAMLLQSLLDDSDVQFRNVVDELDTGLQEAFSAQRSSIGDDWWNHAEQQYERAQCNLERWLKRRKRNPFSDQPRDIKGVEFPPEFISSL